MASGGSQRVGGSQQSTKKRDRPENESDSERAQEMRKMTKFDEESGFKIIIKFKDKSDKALNPLSLSEELKNKMGSVLNAKRLSNGNILVFCKSEAQRLSAMKVRHLLNRPVECFIPGKTQNAKGVIYISPEITESAIVKNLEGAEIETAHRFKESGTAVLLTFKQETMPMRVYLGYMSFQVKQYIRPPLRCYKCQRFGHVAAVCRGNKRCGKCGGNHDFAQCQAEEIKCCNCGGNHTASFRGCEHHVRALEVERMKVEGKMSYADALKRVRGVGETTGTVKASAASSLPVAPRQTIGTQSLLAFMADVLWAARNQTKRSDIIRVVVHAADRFLEEVFLGPEELHVYMKQKLEVYEKRRRERRCSDRSEDYGEEGSMETIEDDC